MHDADYYSQADDSRSRRHSRTIRTRSRLDAAPHRTPASPARDDPAEKARRVEAYAAMVARGEKIRYGDVADGCIITEIEERD